MQIRLPSKLKPVFEGKARYRGAYGGRGSGKSAGFAQMLLIAGMQRKHKILCGREIQNSIKESVHAELCKWVDKLGLGWFYTCGENFIRGRNGTEVIYKGFLRNLDSIKSMSGVTLVLLEEAEKISERSWSTLDPTIREPGAEIWAVWNPEVADSPTAKRYNPDDPDVRVAKINWRDNPWFPAALDVLRLKDMRRDYDAYLHIWEGEPITRSDAQVLRGKWRIDDFTPGDDWDGPYLGADWGFSTDPTTLVKCWIYNARLYVEYEAYGMHTELEDIPELFDHVPGARRYKIEADNARPETISYVKRKGFTIEGVEKWPGSVEDGIEHMRGAYDEIIVHSRCLHTAEEMRLYSHKIDRLTDEVLPDIIDKHNHCIDAIRYALGKLIKYKFSILEVL